MQKNIEDIIVPERKKSIRDIPIPDSRRRNPDFFPPSRPAPAPQNTNPDSIKYEYEYPPSEPKNNGFDFHRNGGRFGGMKRKGLWASIVIAVLILIFAVLSVLDGATLSYVSKSTPLSFNNDLFSAYKTGDDRLLYSVIKLSADKGVEVSASGEEQVSRKASGRIVVFNNATKEPQKLRATTRFQTTDGKIYQVQEAVSIPGKKVVGGVSQPGSLEITVYAERPGAEYNVGLMDLTLPGLKGSSLFSTIYARSKTEMTGGFVGTERAVSVDDQAKAKAGLKVTLRDQLISEANAQVPEGFVLLPALSLVTYEDLAQTGAESKDSATINMRGNLYGVMFKETDLANHLASGKTNLKSEALVDIVELESLNFAFNNFKPEDLLSAEKIDFTVTGEGTLVWRTDETALKSDLAGRNKRDISSILVNYPTVVTANATIRPFWKSSFPEDSSEIQVKKVSAK